jgi:cytochrome c biogenesis protein CcmG, thiol:disulfide interchange protein DsbE
MRIAAIVLATVALIAVLVIGLSQAGSQGGKPKPTKAPTGEAAQHALRGSPPKLAALHAQASDLLPGGRKALDDRLASLKGYPAVVNGWASWCGPCRFEFPFFQSASVKFGKQVAFVGLNVTDNQSDARRFLGEFPLPYPSYVDERGTAMQHLVPSAGLPNTVFFNREGKETYVHQGGYPTQAKLWADVRRYALDART